MVRKLPLATAAVIIVAAAIGAWMIWGQAPTVTRPTGATIKAGYITVLGAAPVESGIENIYIMDYTNGYDNTLAMNDPANEDNILDVITSSGGTATIDYDVAFDIVIAYKADWDNTAYNAKENAQMEVAMSGAVTFSQENVADGYEIVFENSGQLDAKSAAADYIRVNVIHDNWVNLTLSAGEIITLDPVKLWCWG